MESERKRTRALTRKNALWTERSSWDSQWQEIARYQMPRGGRFFNSDVNKGGKKGQSIYDNTPVFALRTLAAGMMSGVTSPARPWFQLAIADKDLMEFEPVKQWLHQVSVIMRRVFNASNTYNSLHQCYEELGAFGTWANFVQPDFQNVIHHYPMTIGEYALGHNDKGVVDTCVRDFDMTVGQMMKQFGRDKCSSAVRNLADRGTFDAWVKINHIVGPRSEWDPSKRDARNMAFESCYFEPAADNWEEYLSESGFKRFPTLAPRWVVTGNDIYGRSPGMDCIGDAKQLQLEQLRKSQAIDYQVNPPIQVPLEYKDQANKRMPGGVMFVSQSSPSGGVRSAYDVNVRLDYLLEDIKDTRDRIRQACYADLFLMLANDQRSGTTATEIAERHEEKLLMLGPVLERLHNELLSPLIDITFDRLATAGVLPPAPEEIAGKELDIEFISTLAQAQRAVAASGMDRLLGTIGQAAGLWPEMRHKIDALQVVDDYAMMYGVNPKAIVPDEIVKERMAAEAEAQQAATAGPAMAQAVDSAKTASEINSQGIQDVMGMFSGYNTPTPGVGG